MAAIVTANPTAARPPPRTRLGRTQGTRRQSSDVAAEGSTTRGVREPSSANFTAFAKRSPMSSSEARPLKSKRGQKLALARTLFRLHASGGSDSSKPSQPHSACQPLPRDRSRCWRARGPDASSPPKKSPLPASPKARDSSTKRRCSALAGSKALTRCASSSWNAVAGCIAVASCTSCS